jgi:hypothetical protein
MEQESGDEALPDSVGDGQEATGFFGLLVFSVTLIFFVAPRLELVSEDICQKVFRREKPNRRKQIMERN